MTNQRYNPKDFSKFDMYDKEQKMSIARCAFESKHMAGDPPHEQMFHFARAIGYQIPDKWKDMYND